MFVNVIINKYVRDTGYCFELGNFLCKPKSEQSRYFVGAAEKWRSGAA